MVFGPAGFQKIIYNHYVILYKHWLSLRFIIGQSKYKFKGVFHGEKESYQIHFQEEACAEKSRICGEPEEKNADQESCTSQAETGTQVKTGAQAGKKGSAKNQACFGERPSEEKI